MPNIQQNLNNGINNDNNINIPQSSPPFNINNRNDDDLQKQLAFIKEKLFLNEDINLPIKEKIKSSAVIKSKRFHPSRSFDNVEMNPSPPRKKAIIRYSNNNNNNLANNNSNNNLVNRNNDNDFNNNLFNDNMNNIHNIPNKNNYNNIKDFNDNLDKNNNLEFQNNMNNIYNNNKNYIPNNINLNNLKEKMEKMNRVQNFLDKLYNQSGEVVKRFKKIYGDDIEDRILNGEINDENLNEMDNILDKIIKMSIWGKEDENIKENKRDKSSSYDKKEKKRKHRFVYNALEERMKLINAVNNKQAYFKEYPRGWYSTKEYFINNGTEINNDNINKYA